MPDRPNILLLLTDQQRYDCLGVTNPQLRTPHLDTLAAGADRFARSYCAYPVCAPSRYSLLSGLAVRQHGCWLNASTLPPTVPTFPRLLRAAGYRTHAVGKMHLTPTYLDVGFDRLELAEQCGDGRLEDDYHRDLRAAGLLDRVDLTDQREEFRREAGEDYWRTFGAQVSDLPEEWHSTTWVGDRAVRAIDGWSGGGNLLMAGFIKPHHPFDPPQRWADQYDPAQVDPLPGWAPEGSAFDQGYYAPYFSHAGLDEGALRRVTAHYYATISQIDEQVGRILAALRARGLYDDTLIVFTSDHGEYLGFHHLILKAGPPYDPLVRVPLLIKWPGQSRGTVRDVLAVGTDLAPTILAQCGLEPAPGMTGLNLADPGATRSCVFLDDKEGQQVVAVSQRYKLALHRGPHKCLLFDLETDKLEQHNRLHDPDYAEIAQAHREAIADWVMATVPWQAAADAPVVHGPAEPVYRQAVQREMLGWMRGRCPNSAA